MKQLPLFFLFLTLGLFSATAQNGQTVKGQIIDKESEMPLIGATVEWINGESTQGTTTDVDGYFRLENVGLGRQSFRVSYLGYRPLDLPSIEVTSGKEVLLNIGLEESVTALSEVVVTAEVNKEKAQNELATVSARTFSVEEVNRFSGGRSDVGRLAANFAGVSTPDDSRNDIVIRGNSPTGVLWRLEGIPIPNPNHFSTLGTTGGPVSALNTNLLRNSDFLTGAFPAEYGDALAGVFDLGFRNGNRDQHEFMFQLGAFTGFEAMAEGPLSKGSDASYLVAGRYSFTGVAGSLGLDIGTNAIPNYQDIAFKIDFGNSDFGKFSLFGIGGTSDIEFLHDETDEDDLFASTDEDAVANSSFGVLGLRHNLLLSNKGYLRTVISASTSGNGFENFRFYQQDTPQEERRLVTRNDNRQNRYSFSSYWNQKHSARLTTRIGVLVETYDNQLFAESNLNQPDRDDDGIPDFVTNYDFNEGTTLSQVYAQAKLKPSDRLTLNAGLHYQYLGLNGSNALEPRLGASYQLSPSSAINLGYGLHHQSAALPILLLLEETSEGVFEATNKDLDFSRSHHFVLGFDTKLGKDWRAKIETYYQDISQVPVEPTPSSFSMLNLGDDFGFPDDVFNLQNDGTGSNVGVELTLEKFFSNGYYALLTTSVFDSKYTGSDGLERNTAFNNGYVVNVLMGKEWVLGKKKRTFFTIDTKVTTAGGRYYTPIDLAASNAIQDEVLIDELAYSERNDPYFRWDVKFGLKRNSLKKKISHTFFLDIQNLSNNENLFARRYNRQTNEINEVLQTGFFPDFLYRITF